MHTLTRNLLRAASGVVDRFPWAITYGCDPEVFARDAKGVPRSLIGKIGGSKKAPLKVPFGAVQEDNVAAEFNTDPVTTMNAFRTRVVSMRRTVFEKIAKAGLRPYVAAHAYFPEEELKDPKAAEFGCEPDFNVWTGEENPTPSAEQGLRTAAGHVHIGIQANRRMEMTMRRGSREDDDTLKCDRIVVLADLYIGVPSVLLDPDVTRRKLYGRAGAYRVKHVGEIDKPLIVEYRTPSNFWITNQKTINWMWRQMQMVGACSLGMQSIGDHYPDPETVQKCINEGDVKVARELVDAYDIPMPGGYAHAND